MSQMHPDAFELNVVRAERNKLREQVAAQAEELSEQEKTISHLSRQFFELDKEYVCLSTKSALDEKKITEISLEALAAQGQAQEHFEETLRLKKQICQMAEDAIRLEDEVDELTEQLAASQQRVAELEKERDQMNVYCAQAERRANDMAEERDKATKYWNIAEGRCDAMKQQRDVLVNSAELLIKAMAGTQAETDFAFQMFMLEDAIASVKEKE